MTLLAKPEELIGQLSAQGIARSTVAGAPLTAAELDKIDAYWRACNYLALGMLYLRDNPLLREPLAVEHLFVSLIGNLRVGDGDAAEQRLELSFLLFVGRLAYATLKLFIDR